MPERTHPDPTQMDPTPADPTQMDPTHTVPSGLREGEVAGEAGAEGDEERRLARKRVTARRDFASHLVAYVVVNGFLIGVWAMSGAGYFWPAWVLAGWGIGLLMHAWDAFLRRPVTEADVDAEIRRQRDRH